MSRSLTENFVKQFELCKVVPGEVVAVIAELGGRGSPPARRERPRAARLQPLEPDAPAVRGGRP